MRHTKDKPTAIAFRKWTAVVFGLYLFLLAWLILLKFQIDLSMLSHMRSVNLIPFAGSLVINGRLAVHEIIYNMLVFVPLGVYVQIYRPHWSIGRRLLPGLSLSLLFELIQYMFAIGASDITDVIGNTLGGIFGVGLCLLVRSFAPKQYVTLFNAVGSAIEITALLLLAVLFAAN